MQPLQWQALAQHSLVIRAKLSIHLTWQRPAQKWPGPHEKDRDKKGSCSAQLKEQIKFLHEKWRRVWATTEFSPSFWSVILRHRHLSSSFSLVSQGSIFHPSTSNISTAVSHSSGPPDAYLIKLIGCHLTTSHETRFGKLAPLGIKHPLCARFSIPMVLISSCSTSFDFLLSLSSPQGKENSNKIRIQAYLQTKAQALLRFLVFEELELVLHLYQRRKNKKENIREIIIFQVLYKPYLIMLQGSSNLNQLKMLLYHCTEWRGLD